MIQALYRSSDGKLDCSLPLEEIPQALEDAGGLVWVNIVEEDVEASAALLRDVFKFHPLAIEDAMTQSNVAKIDDWIDYLYIALYAIIYDGSEDDRIDTLELSTFLGENYLITYHKRPIPSVERIWSNVARGERYLERGAGYLFYSVADEIAADFMPVIERIDVTVDRIEDLLFGSPRQHLLEELFALKRAVLHMRRLLAPQREVLNKLARGDYEIIDEEERLYFRDVYDHFVRLHDITEGVRDLVAGALETYLSVVNNRMNSVMKVLTIITTLFMPLTFLTGFFGMNFFQPINEFPAWTSEPVLILVVAVMLAAPLGMLVWMHRRGWM